MPADLKSHFFNALLNAWGLIRHLAPYVVSGVILGAALNTFVPREKLAGAVRRCGLWALPISGAAGMISPACTYGAAAVLCQMIRSGAPLAPAATFLVASSLVNPQMFILTLGALGTRLALAQVAVSFAFAVSIGLLVDRLARAGVDLASADASPARDARVKGSHRRRDSHSDLPWANSLLREAVDLGEFIGFYFVMGTVVAALMSEFVPGSLVVAAFGEGKWWAAPCAALVSVPVYVCGGGTIPVLAVAREMGMTSGAILAFLIAGPATRITALSSFAVCFRPRAVVTYVLTCVSIAALIGTVLGAVTPALPPRLPGGP